MTLPTNALSTYACGLHIPMDRLIKGVSFNTTFITSLGQMCTLYNDFQGISLENYEAQSVGIFSSCAKFVFWALILVLNKMNAFGVTLV